MKTWAISTNLPVNSIVSGPRLQSGGKKGQETFSAPSANKKTRNYDKRVLKPPWLAFNPQVKVIKP